VKKLPPRKKKSKTTKTEPKTKGWWDTAEPLGEFLPKFVGFNYYHLLNDGVLSEGTIDGDKVVNVEFKAEFVQLTDVDGEELSDSPDEALEGTLSIPLSVARKIRAYLEEQKLKVSDVSDKILRLQKTGSGIKTRYPTVKLINPDDFYEE